MNAQVTKKSSNDVSKLSTKERFQALLDIMRERIIQLEYPPGSRIGEEELAREFGISRTPLRRVLSWLEFEELVEIRHGSGNYISEIDEKKMAEYYHLRVLLYEVAGNLPKKSIPGEVLEKMRSVLSDTSKKGKNLSVLEYRQFNTQFQKLTTECMENNQLRRFIDRLYFITYRHWYLWQPHLSWEEEIEDFVRLMQDVIRCHEIDDTKGAYLVRRNYTVGMLNRISAARALFSPEVPGA